MLVKHFTREHVEEHRKRTAIEYGKTYQFVIRKIEEKNYTGGNCFNMHLVPLNGDDELDVVFENLFTEPKRADDKERLIDFFESINAMKLFESGEVPGYMLLNAVGQATFKESTYKDRETGETKKSIKVDRFIPIVVKHKPEFDDDIPL